MTFPNTFAPQAGPIPLQYLDDNFNALTAPTGSSLVGFIQSGTGAVARTATDKLRESVSVLDFYANGVSGAGVDPTGILDSTLGIQAAINSLSKIIVIALNGTVTALSGTLYFPAGKYKITSPLVVANGYGVTLVGDGVGSTELVWSTNNSAIDLIDFSDCSYCKIQKMSLIAAQPAHFLVKFYNNAATTTITSQSNTLQDVELNGNYNVFACITVGGGLDANNDFMQFDRVVFMGYSHSGAFLQGFQSHMNHFFDCTFLGINLAQTATNGLYGVFAKLDVTSSQAPSFIFERGISGWHAGADFFIGGGNSTGYIIKSASSENSLRFLDTSSTVPSQNAPITILGCRIESAGVSSDGNIIINNMQGPLTIQGCTIGSGGSPIPVLPRIFLNNTVQNVAHVTGNTFPYTYSATLGTVAITGIAGQFSCAATTLFNGMAITVAGLYGGTGSITGYINPTTYYIIATNGTTTFQLSATPGGVSIATTAGTPTGLTYTVTSTSYDATSLVVNLVGQYNYSQITYERNSFITPIKPAASNFFLSTSQTTVPVYFGYGPYKINNTVATNVANLTAAYPFQKIMLFVNDAATTFVNTGNIRFQNKVMPYSPGAIKQFELVYNSDYGFWTEANVE